MIATIWEVWNDRHGDLNKLNDLIARVALIIIEALTISLIFHKPGITCLLISTAVFFMFFDYAITYVLIKNGIIEPRIGGGYSWFTYTAKKGLFDTMEWWKFSPWIRLGIKLAYFTISLILFIKI
jgi:hypothetical protein